MNEKALELGLESTSFADPSGLNPDNISSAYDLSRLISFAAADERIAPIMRTAEYQVSTSRRTFSIHSTNRLVLGGDVDVMGGQDRLHQQGRLLPGDAAAAADRQSQVAVVVLGARSNPAASGRRATCSTGCPTRPPDVFVAKEPQPSKPRLLVALLHRCRVQRQRRHSHPPPASPAATRAAHRTP